MKILNILGLTILLAYVSATITCELTEYLLGNNAISGAISIIIIVPIVVHARQLIEKFLGYTTYEAMKGKQDEP